MAAVIALQSPAASGPAASTGASFQQPHSSDQSLRRPRSQHHQSTSSTSTPISPCAASIGSIPRLPAPGQDGSSCDACLRRRSRCAMNEMVNKCYSCDFHRQDCTFTLSRPNTADRQFKKRKLEDPVAEEVESAKRQQHQQLPPVSHHQSQQQQLPAALSPVSRTDVARSPVNGHNQLIPPGYWSQSAQYIGMTTELEPALLEHLPLDHNDEGVIASTRVRKIGDDGTFMRVVDPSSQADAPSSTSLDAIESLVAPYGSTLVEKYFESIHPVFPILMEDAFRQSYRTRHGLSPLLLSAVYVLALKFVDVSPASQTVRRPDLRRLERTALKLLLESLPYATISTIQAGLLLMEKSSLATAALNAQLVTAGFELGLHQDCTDWNMETWEKGLRKRLAWALYMQDKWSALVHGRPSHIFAFNWTVKDLVEQDFTDAFHADSAPSSQQDDSPVGHGALYFCHMVALTTILSDILDRFYTLQAIEEFKAAGGNRTRMILERAKPAQIRLKEWFASLPPTLKMDSSLDLFDTVAEDTARNGPLHLSYFATEITLHRCIIRSLTPDTTDAYLSHICRSAAKTRLISAMDFVNRLRQPHLRSFWPAASRTNFSLIGSFGILLRITAPTKEEAEFYRLRLCEYRWTLGVSRKDAEFLDFALESLDNATNLDRHVPSKPAIDELMTSASKPTINTTRMSASELDESMLEMEAAPDSSRGGTSSVISGLASPATSISDESIQDDLMPL